MKMNEPPELQRMKKTDIVHKICFGRSCHECPLLRFPENCNTLPRQIIVDAYCKVFDVLQSEITEFEVTEEELMNIISGE